MDVRTEADVDAFWDEVNRRVAQARARNGYVTLVRERTLETDLADPADPTRDALIEAALGWAGADGPAMGGKSYAALRGAIHAYRTEHP